MPNVDKWALSADIRFRLKAVISHSVHFRFWRAAVGKFDGCRKWVSELELWRPECARRGEPLASLCTDDTEEAAALSALTFGFGFGFSFQPKVPLYFRWHIRFRPNVIRRFRPTFGYGRKWNFHFRSTSTVYRSAVACFQMLLVTSS